MQLRCLDHRFLKHGKRSGGACIHASLRAGPTIAAHKQLKRAAIKPQQYILRHRNVSRTTHSTVLAALHNERSNHGHDYAPFSVELLLAVARLGHLERYREEIQMFYEPGAPTDLTRCALLISNIYNPQMDHRPYYRRLEDLTAAAALASIQAVSQLFDKGPTSYGAVGSSTGTPSVCQQCTQDSDTHPVPTVAAPTQNLLHHITHNLSPADADYALDPSNPDHMLCAVSAINDVLFESEGLYINTADPHDPVNGSLCDVMDRKAGNQYSLAVVYLHIASALGLPAVVVGSPEHTLIRIGDPYAASDSSNSSEAGTRPAVYLLDVADGGTVYQWRRPGTAASSNSSNSSNAGDSSSLSSPPAAAAAELGPDDQPGSLDDQWQQHLSAWVKKQQEQQAAEDSHSFSHDIGKFSSTHSSDPHNGEEAYMLGGSGSSSDSIDSFNIGEADSNVCSDGWSHVEGHAAQDAASRNSWKALYGPGALTEWGGLVSSSSSTGLTSAAVGRHANILQSPFAAAAQLPFEDEAVDVDGCMSVSPHQSVSESTGQCSLSSTDKVLSDTDSSTGSNAMETSPDHSVTPSSAASYIDTGAALPVILELSDDLAVKYGGFQPVSSRLLLQKLLSAMKLSLTLSGRDEEALSVIRYLRATDPFALPDLRDEGLLLAQMQQHEPAVLLLREYLAVAPGAADAAMVREILEQQLLAVQIARTRARRQQ